MKFLPHAGVEQGFAATSETRGTKLISACIYKKTMWRKYTSWRAKNETRLGMIFWAGNFITFTPKFAKTIKLCQQRRRTFNRLVAYISCALCYPNICFLRAISWKNSKTLHFSYDLRLISWIFSRNYGDNWCDFFINLWQVKLITTVIQSHLSLHKSHLSLHKSNSRMDK